MSAQLQPQKPSLTLKRGLNAAPAKVYAAWTDPKKLAQWWGPEGSETLEAKLDVRVGGRFFILFRHDNDEHGVGGEYREIVPNERLAFTWAWRSTPERQSFVILTFKPDDGGTILTLHHEQFFDEAARDGHNRGWSSSLDRLENLFA